MLGKLFRQLKKEFSHYKKLNENARDLMLSFVLYNTGAVVTDLFYSAYIWSSSNDINLIVVFYLSLFCYLPFGFLLNGVLLRYFRIKHLFGLGMLVEGFTGVILVFMGELNVWKMVPLGVFSGMGVAFYWANRNYLTLHGTEDDERNYFFSIQKVLNTFAGLVLPALVGLFLAFGSDHGLYTSLTAYKILMIVMMLVFFLAAAVLQDNKFEKPHRESLFIIKPRRSWWYLRLFVFLNNVQAGVMFFVGTLLVLILVGEEDALGFLSSLSVLFTMVVTYYIGRFTKPRHRVALILVGSVLYILGALPITILYSSLGVILYKFVTGISSPFNNMFDSIIYKAIESQSSDRRSSYKELVDMEIYTNLGRIAGIAMFVILVNTYSEETALRVIPLVASLSALFIPLAAKKIEDNLDNKRQAKGLPKKILD